jgi:hypothetical protein
MAKDTKDEQTVEIELEAAQKPPVADEVKVEKAEEAPPKVEIEPAEGIETLKAQLERERAARIAAEKRAHEATEASVKAQNEVQDSNLSLIVNAIETIKQNAEVLKQKYREAASQGDWDGAAEVQQAMSTNAAKLLQLEQGKEALEQAPKPKAPPAPPSDPVEALASQLSPRSGEWIRRNPQFVTDQRAYQRMIAAHNLVISDGIAADTDEYFAEIETLLKVRKAPPPAPAATDAMADAAKVTQRRSTPPASAPVSRDSGTRPNVVRLTQAEREIAASMQMTEQEYAKNKLALQKEGKLN